MIITRTPFRVSFVGGGSDLRDFYKKNGYGAVVSVAIKKYMYIVIHPYFHDKIRIKYSKTEDVDSIDEIKHPIVRECLKKVQIDKGVEIASFADVSAGTGLGSSSAFTVGLLHALYAYKGRVVSKERLAREACEIEIEILGEPIGKQDQYAVAFGNLNYIKFYKDETVAVTPIVIDEDCKNNLEQYLYLYYTGGVRSANLILNEQKNNILNEYTIRYLKKMLILVEKFREMLNNKNIQGIDRILNDGWYLKKKLAKGISNTSIEELYLKAIANGATGGKLLGAGGEGFLLLCSNNHQSLIKKMKSKTLPFKIDKEGTKILFYE